jgi:NAD(P)-dependent dehydrogenase (short-subunit alcohol dehydrogenase family)
MDMSEKVVVITGASMGIGEAIAKLFADHGAAIVFSSRDQARAEAARARVAPRQPSMAVACDVCDAAQISALVRATLERFERIDVWVNNAGFGVIDSIEHMERQAYRRMFETNLFGAIEAMQQVIPVMKRQKSGCIINISSVAGYIAVPYMGAYGATKRALNAISRAARLELEGSGVSVVNICPGYVKTDFGENAVRGTEGKRISAGSQRGITVLRAYQHDITETVVPWTNRLAIGLALLAPFVVNFALRRLLKDEPKRTT